MEKKSLNKQNSPHKKGSFKPDSLSTEVRNVLKITTENFSFHVKMNQNIHSEWHKDSRFEVRTKETIPGWWINTSSRRSSWKSIIQRRWKRKSVKFFSKQKLRWMGVQAQRYLLGAVWVTVAVPEKSQLPWASLFFW